MRLVEPSARIITPNCELRTSMHSGAVPVLAHRTDQPLDIDLLLASTDDKRLSSRRTPAGTMWCYTEIPVGPRRSAFSHKSLVQPQIQVVRYALDSTVLPLVTETLTVAEAVRRALMGIHGWLTEKNDVRGRSDVLSGKDEQGERLIGHGHAYYLPTDEDGDGRLDHLTVYSAQGFGPDERSAFDRLRELRTGRGVEESHPLRLLLLGMGNTEEYRPGPLKASCVWVSATPYIATRYAKTRGRHRIDLGSPDVRAEFLQEDLRAQLSAVRSDLVEEEFLEVQIEPLWDANRVFLIADRWRTIQFKRFRNRAGDDGGQRLAGAFRLTFRKPVFGPVSLGWSNHFGLGQFMAK